MKRIWNRLMNATSATGEQKANGRPRRWRRIVAGTAGTAVAGIWVSLHVFPSFGPAAADGVRALVGPGPVAWAEDVVYGVEDRVKGVVYHDAPPKTFWEADPNAPQVHAPAQPPIASNAPVAPTFALAAFDPPFPRVAGPGDGKWIAIADPGAPDDPPRMYKAAVHPDPKRGYAAVAVVAVDLARLSLAMVAGTVEPASADVPPSERPGLVPVDRFGDLVAAFNGGFKAEHGHYGMMLGGRTFLPPRETSCTIALYQDGSLQIRSWPAVKEAVADMAGYRQTPPCLVEQGRVNDTLAATDDAHGWGAAVGGATTIRRSALGLDREGKTLFYGLGESVSAGTLARAMKAAGAEDAAQLDVNAAYPRFVFYGKAKANELPTTTGALIPDIAYARHEYVGKPEGRDFFYLTRKAP
jgi:hypothetical protein